MDTTSQSAEFLSEAFRNSLCGAASHRFGVGDEVFAIDGTVIDVSDQAAVRADPHDYRPLKVVKATVRELHTHTERHPGYPNGEGYRLQGELEWDCYPGNRVFASQEEAEASISRLTEILKEQAVELRDEQTEQVD